MSDIQYTIYPIDGLGHYFEVELRILKPNPFGQKIQMPNWIPGSYMVRDFSKHILSIQAFALDKDLKVKEPLHLQATHSDTWVIEAYAKPILVKTTIYAFDFSVRTAFLDSQRGFFNFSSLCLQVVDQTKWPIDCWIASTPLTKKWELVTSLTRVKVDSSGFGKYHAKNYATLIDHPVSMGKFVKISWKSYGVVHHMVLQGTQLPLDTKKLQEDLKAICNQQIAFFEPKKLQAPFLQYIFHVNVVGNGYGGLEHRSSTALICKRSDLPYARQVTTPETTKAYQDFLGLCSHEYFHAWMVKKVQPLAFQPYRLNTRNFTKLLWLFEGFTSYYDDLHLLRSARIDETTYFGRILDTYHQVLRNPGRTHQSVAQSSFDAWTKYYLMDENTPNAVVSYYAKGSLIALALDVLIREYSQQTKSLDDVMRYLWQEHGARGDEVGIGLTEDGFDKVLQKSLGNAFTPLWIAFKSAYIEGTQDINIPEIFTACGIAISAKELSSSEIITQVLGIRTRICDQQLKITHVLNGYSAHAAGLCPQDVILAVNAERVTPANWSSVLTRNSSTKMKITIFRDDLLKTISLSFPNQRQAHLLTKMYQIKPV